MNLQQGSLNIFPAHKSDMLDWKQFHLRIFQANNSDKCSHLSQNCIFQLGNSGKDQPTQFQQGMCLLRRNHRIKHQVKKNNVRRDIKGTAPTENQRTFLLGKCYTLAVLQSFHVRSCTCNPKLSNYLQRTWYPLDSLYTPRLALRTRTCLLHRAHTSVPVHHSAFPVRIRQFLVELVILVHHCFVHMRNQSYRKG